MKYGRSFGFAVYMRIFFVCLMKSILQYGEQLFGISDVQITSYWDYIFEMSKIGI